MGLNLLQASDGTGEAVRASVTNIRTAGSTTIMVDDVTNWPTNFIATAGTEIVDANNNTILDPATVIVFSGHLSGSTIIIDALAPGYTDPGSAVDDVVIIKPTTMWADQIHTLLAAIMNDDGSLKNNAVTTASIAASAVTSAKLAPSRTTDANGWTVYDMGTWKRYTKRVTFSATVTASSIAALTPSSSDFPVGITNIGNHELSYSHTLSVGFGADCEVAIESLNTGSSTSFTWSIRNNSSSSRTFTGFIEISITER